MKSVNEELKIIEGIIVKFKDQLLDAMNDKVTLLSMPDKEKETRQYKEAWKCVAERISDIELSIKLLENRKKELLNQ